MVNPEVGNFRNGRFGPVGDTGTGAFDHGKIVCPVADRQRFREIDRLFGNQFFQPYALGIAPENGFSDFAGQLAVILQERVGLDIDEPDQGRDGI